MAMDFPNSPTVNQTFTVGDKTWKWSGAVWEIVVNRPAMRSVADTPPASPIVGDEWFNSLTGKTYTWFDSYWIEVNTNSVVGASGLNGVASASAPLVYNSTNNNISVQTNPTFTGATTLNTGSTSEVALIVEQSATAAASQMVSRGAGYLGWIGQRTDATRRFAFEANPSQDSGANFGLYLYNSAGGSNKQVFGTSYASGALTLPNHPYIKVDGNNFAWYDLADGSTVTGTYVSPTYTRGGMTWNGTNGRITVPVAGCYEMSYTSYSTTGQTRMHLRKNGGSFTMCHKYEASDAQRAVVGTVDAAANDYFDVWIEYGVSHYYGGNHTFFTLKLLG